MTAYSDNPGSSTAKLRGIFASAIKRHDSKLSDPKQRELATDIVYSILVVLIAIIEIISTLIILISFFFSIQILHLLPS